MTVHTMHDEINYGRVLADFKPVPSDLAGAKLQKLTYSSTGAEVGRFNMPDGQKAILVHDTKGIVQQDWVAILLCTNGEPREFTDTRTGRVVEFTPKEVLTYRYMGVGQVGIEEGQAWLDELAEGERLVACRDLDGFGDNGELEVEEGDGLDVG